MARTPQQAPDLLSLHTAVSGLTTAVKYMTAVGAAAIIGGGYVAWDLSSGLGELKHSLGIIEGGSAKSLNDKIDDVLEKLQNAPAQRSEEKKSESLVPVAPPDNQLGMTGWQGIQTNPETAAKILSISPNKPVWIYTQDPDTAKALQSYPQ